MNLFHIIYLRNAGGMQLEYQQENSITWKATTGIMDFKMFIDNKAEDVIKRYHRYINGAILHPFWA